MPSFILVFRKNYAMPLVQFKGTDSSPSVIPATSQASTDNMSAFRKGIPCRRFLFSILISWADTLPTFAAPAVRNFGDSGPPRQVWTRQCARASWRFTCHHRARHPTKVAYALGVHAHRVVSAVESAVASCAKRCRCGGSLDALVLPALWRVFWVRGAHLRNGPPPGFVGKVGSGQVRSKPRAQRLMDMERTVSPRNRKRGFGVATLLVETTEKFANPSTQPATCTASW